LYRLRLLVLAAAGARLRNFGDDMWQLLIPAITSILDKILPDPQAQAAAKLQIMEMAQRGELAQLDADVKLALGQLDVNKAEASSGNAFASSWRPSVGYVCVLGLFYSFLLQPILPWLAALFGHPVPPLPDLNSEVLMTLVAGMLGIGGMRSVEKVKGVA
jgi:hypothetical protein